MHTRLNRIAQTGLWGGLALVISAAQAGIVVSDDPEHKNIDTSKQVIDGQSPDDTSQPDYEQTRLWANPDYTKSTANAQGAAWVKVPHPIDPRYHALPVGLALGHGERHVSGTQVFLLSENLQGAFKGTPRVFLSSFEGGRLNWNNDASYDFWQDDWPNAEAVGSEPDGTFWVLAKDGRMARTRLLDINNHEQKQIANPTTIPGRASALFTGPNGNVWHLSQQRVNEGGYNMYRFDQRTPKQWVQVRGQATKVALGSGGNVWHMNSLGRMYRSSNNGASWTQVRGEASDIAVAPDGTAYHLSKVKVDDGGHALYRSTNNGAGWQKMPGTFKAIAVSANGTVWAIDDFGGLYREGSKPLAYNPTGWICPQGFRRNEGRSNYGPLACEGHRYKKGYVYCATNPAILFQSESTLVKDVLRAGCTVDCTGDFIPNDEAPFDSDQSCIIRRYKPRFNTGA